MNFTPVENESTVAPWDHADVAGKKLGLPLEILKGAYYRSPSCNRSCSIRVVVRSVTIIPFTQRTIS